MNLTRYTSVTSGEAWSVLAPASLSELAAVVSKPRAQMKAGLPLIGGYTLRAGGKRCNEDVERVTAIIGDYDGGTVSLIDAANALDDAGVDGLIYSSPSWTQAAPRWRVVCPLSEPVAPEQHRQLAARLNGIFDGILAQETFTLSQPYYIGGIGDRPPHTFPIDGEPLDLMPELDAKAIHKSGAIGTIAPPTISSGRIAHRNEHISIMRTPAVTMPVSQVVEYLDRLPNDGPPDWHAFNRLGMCVYNATLGSAEGFHAFDAWASHNPAYDANMVAERWQHWGRSPADHLDARNLADICREMGGTMPPPPDPPPGGASLGKETRESFPNAGGVESEATPRHDQGKIKASVFQWTDPSGIPPRDWIYGMHYIRKFLTATIAVGGAGKSANAILEAVSMAIGRDLLNGGQTIEKRRVWYFNSEDPIEELQRRVLAVCIEYDINTGDLGDRLFINSGRDFHLVVAHKLRDGVHINAPLVEDLTAEIQAQGIDVLIIDPLVHTHEVDENSNGDVARVCEVWRHVAEDGNCSVELIHHTRKLNGAEADADSGRGGSAITGAVRHQRVINRVSADIAARHNIPEDERGGVFYFGVGEKSNLVPNHDKAVFRRLVSVPLGNGTPLYPDGDTIGVVTTYTPPEATDGVTVDHLEMVQKALRSTSETRWRKSPQSAEWVGYLVADVCELDPVDDKKRISKIIGTWIHNKALRHGNRVDARRKPVPSVECGEAVKR